MTASDQLNPAEIKVSFQHTEAEYLAACRMLLLHGHGNLLRVPLVLVLLLIYFVIFAYFTFDGFFLMTLFPITLIPLGFIFYKALVAVPRRAFRGNPTFQDQYELTFSDAGVMVKSSRVESKMAWSLYTKVIESHDLFLLVYGKNLRVMTLVPKRAFQTPGQQDAFRLLLRRHITEYTTTRSLRTQISAEPEYIPVRRTPSDWR